MQEVCFAKYSHVIKAQKQALLFRGTHGTKNAASEEITFCSSGSSVAQVEHGTAPFQAPVLGKVSAGPVAWPPHCNIARIFAESILGSAT
jgi:hypothetical protein